MRSYSSMENLWPFFYRFCATPLANRRQFCSGPSFGNRTTFAWREPQPYRLNSCKYVTCSGFLFCWLCSRLCIPWRHHSIKGNFSLLALTPSIPRTTFSPPICCQYDTKFTIYSHGPWKQVQKSSYPSMVSQFGFRSLSLESILSLDHFFFTVF